MPVPPCRCPSGLLAAFVLQLGCTVLLGRLASAWTAQGSARELARSLGLLPESLPEQLLAAFIWLQCSVVLAAVVCNVALHVRLRRQLLALPREVFFGQRPPPASYGGPDLEDLRSMGRSTLVYGMYFPGILFWNFFYGSCVLVVITLFLVGSLVVVLQPADHRSSFAASVWPWLMNLAFFCSVLLAHFATRLFVQRCLLHRHDRGFFFVL
ncbi:unnamed protein product [Prorocentrum cordatum]|uniref:Protein S-acyltransferase n=1 Tax=Prorocentrum cordatum TaxID=2364126 RepID=A0ABN9W6L7_9DINO|nr:unnamed protein product [Polarella glacialis]